LQLDASKVPYCIDFPVLLYECETWSLILREEHRLRVREKWRFMFAPLLNIIPLIRLGIRFSGQAVLMGEKINAYSDMVRNPDEKRSLTIPTGTWEDNIKMGLEQRE
jgi:hypothetical protein